MAFRERGLVVVLGVVLGASWASAEPPKKRSDPKLDIPRVWAARDVIATSWLWTDCTLLPDTNPRQIRCAVTQATVRPPTPDATTAKMAEAITGALRWGKDAAAACWAADRTSLPKTPELRDRALAFSNACKARTGERSRAS